MTDEYDVNQVAEHTGDEVAAEKKRSHNTKGICVVLDEDYNKDQIADLIAAVKQLKGVLTADWLDVGFDDHCNRSRMKVELRNDIKKGLEF